MSVLTILARGGPADLLIGNKIQTERRLHSPAPNSASQSDISVRSTWRRILISRCAVAAFRKLAKANYWAMRISHYDPFDFKETVAGLNADWLEL
jgi:hypothetical protein